MCYEKQIELLGDPAISHHFENAADAYEQAGDVSEVNERDQWYEKANEMRKKRSKDV